MKMLIILIGIKDYIDSERNGKDDNDYFDNDNGNYNNDDNSRHNSNNGDSDGDEEDK